MIDVHPQLLSEQQIESFKDEFVRAAQRNTVPEWAFHIPVKTTLMYQLFNSLEAFQAQKRKMADTLHALLNEEDSSLCVRQSWDIQEALETEPEEALKRYAVEQKALADTKLLLEWLIKKDINLTDYGYREANKILRALDAQKEQLSNAEPR